MILRVRDGALTKDAVAVLEGRWRAAMSDLTRIRWGERMTTSSGNGDSRGRWWRRMGMNFTGRREIEV